MLTQHGQWVAALDRRHELELAFIRLEDTYQWAADLLLQQTASKRSMRNKAELITSGIARDLKTSAGPMPRPISMNGEGARQGYRDGTQTARTGAGAR